MEGRSRVMNMGFGLILATAGAAQAAELFTPPVAPFANQVLRCKVVNVSPHDRTVEAQVVDYKGNVLATSGAVVVAIGAEAGTPDVAESLEIHPRYCKFITQGGGGKGTVRASAQLTDPTTGPILAVRAE